MSNDNEELGDNYNSSDDEDYVPPNEPDECPDEGYHGNEVDDEVAATENGKKNNCHSSEVKEDPEEKKKRINSLWEEFLSTDCDQASTTNAETSCTSEALESKDPCNSSQVESSSAEEEKKPSVVEEIYNFAGEDVKVTRLISEQKPPSSCPSSSTQDNNQGKRKWNSKKGGLSAAANLLSSKRKKLSVLDKSNHDWQEFVHKEGITEDLSQHTRSKDSYLDKQDFLLKAEFLEFQKEKALRKTTRK